LSNYVNESGILVEYSFWNEGCSNKSNTYEKDSLGKESLLKDSSIGKIFS